MDNPVYALKRIQFFGREVPIVLQNENGPCPLLALVNILSLRNQIRLPMKAQHTDQERLIALVANYLIEANSLSEQNGTQQSAEYQANLEQNLADVMQLLPKLCTGVDVNVRFDSIRGFEFTDEIAIFDLLDISLVHGWLVDPEQQREVAQVVNGRTYNQLVSQVVTALGTPAAARCVTPQSTRALLKAASGVSVGAANSSEAAKSEDGAVRLVGVDNGLSAPDTADTAIALELAQIAPEVDAIPDHAQAVPQATMGSGDEQALRTVATPSLSTDASSLVSSTKSGGDTSTSGQPLAAQSTGDAPVTTVMRSAAVWQAEGKGAEEEDGGLVHAMVQEAFRKAAETAAAAADSVEREASTAGGGNVASEAAAAEGDSVVGEAAAGEAVGDAVADSAEVTPLSVRPRLTSEETAAMAAASVAQAFLEDTPSQLTWYGLSQLAAGLKPNQLAVFFRNNHFNTLFHYKGNLYILVTDLGYMWERGVVWEHLCSVHGDTYFCKADFAQYTGEEEPKALTSPPDASSTAAAAGLPGGVAAAAMHGHMAAATSSTHAAAGSSAATGSQSGAPVAGDNRSSGSGVVDELDPDFLLALRLQEEEEERHSQMLARRRQQEAQARAVEQPPSPPPQQQQQTAPTPEQLRLEQRVPQAALVRQQQQQQQPAVHGDSYSGRRRSKLSDKSKDCIVM